jgi:hypothetical protein
VPVGLPVPIAIEVAPCCASLPVPAVPQEQRAKIIASAITIEMIFFIIFSS